MIKMEEQKQMENNELSERVRKLEIKLMSLKGDVFDLKKKDSALFIPITIGVVIGSLLWEFAIKPWL